MISLYNDDCFKILPSITGKSIDLILCDLPYGTTRNKWDSCLDLTKLWCEYKRIIKENGAVILFGQNKFTAKLILSNEQMYRYNLVWDKVLTSGFLNANRMPLVQHEDIVVFYKKLPTYNPQFTVGTPLHGRGTSHKEKPYTNNNYGLYNPHPEITGDTKKYPKSILCFSRKHASKMLHPTEKPVELLEWLVSTYTNEHDLVLDNCMGVGSTGVACKNLNRKFIGIEIEEKYYNIANNRINNNDTI